MLLLLHQVHGHGRMIEVFVTMELNKVTAIGKGTMVPIRKMTKEESRCGVGMIGEIGMTTTEITAITKLLGRNHDPRTRSRSDVSGERGEDRENGQLMLNIGKRGGASINFIFCINLYYLL